MTVLNALDKNKAKSIKNLVEERIITPKEGIFPKIKDLYYLWDGGMIFQHLKELIEEGIAEKIEEKGFLNSKYILI